MRVVLWDTRKLDVAKDFAGGYGVGQFPGGGGIGGRIVRHFFKRDYRPTALVDIRLVALSLEGGSAQWAIGDGDAQALQRYRSLLDASTALRFPADKDRFERAPCAPRLCVEERLTSARWSVDAQSPAAATTSP